jgi:hypothetical protein
LTGAKHDDLRDTRRKRDGVALAALTGIELALVVVH